MRTDAEIALSDRTGDLACLDCGDTWPKRDAKPAPTGHRPLDWSKTGANVLTAKSEHGTFTLDPDPANPGSLRLRHDGGTLGFHVTGPVTEELGKKQAAIWFAVEAAYDPHGLMPKTD